MNANEVRVRKVGSETLVTRDDRPGNVVVLCFRVDGWVDASIYRTDILIYRTQYYGEPSNPCTVLNRATKDAFYFLDETFPPGYFADCRDAESCRKTFAEYRFA